MSKRLLSLAISILFVLTTTNAQIGCPEIVSKDDNGNGIYYYLFPDFTAKVSGSNKARKIHAKMKSVKLPEYIKFQGNNYKVTGISNYAFSHLKNKHESDLTDIILPKTLESIGGHAFDYCPYLRIIHIPNTVKCIGESAFIGCFGLQEVTLPDSINTIEQSVFESCGFHSIVLPNSIRSIRAYAFAGSKIREIKLPARLDSIGENAFLLSSITSIVLPITTRWIGPNAFEGCFNLRYIKGLHKGIYIGKDAIPDKSLEKYYKFDYSQYKKSFEYYANGFVYPRLLEWQKKGEFETSEQYMQRVTKENLNIELQRLTDLALKDFVAKNAYKPNIASYDADNQIFKIDSNYGVCYVKVPLSEAPSFKNSFKSAKFNVLYSIGENNPTISDMTISIGSKQYRAEKNDSVVSFFTSVDIDLPILEIFSAQKPIDNQDRTPNSSYDNDVDINIPTILKDNAYTFAFIIGNEKYQRVSKVPYANNDARIFAEYCRKTLGIPDKNVRMYENATYGTMIGAVSDLQKIAKAFKGEICVIFYYSGHGIPNETTGDAYLLPVDADGMNTEVCYSLSRLYKEFGELGVRRTIVFLDACFSGAERGNGMVVAARGVVIKPKTSQPTGNTIVFSAATGNQAAYPYEEKGHGLFTYYLLKKLHDTKGDVTLGELETYICDEAAKQAVLNKGKEQTPMVLTPIGMGEEWKKWKLKE